MTTPRAPFLWIDRTDVGTGRPFVTITISDVEEYRDIYAPRTLHVPRFADRPPPIPGDLYISHLSHDRFHEWFGTECDNHCPHRRRQIEECGVALRSGVSLRLDKIRRDRRTAIVMIVLCALSAAESSVCMLGVGAWWFMLAVATWRERRAAKHLDEVSLPTARLLRSSARLRLAP